jgi:hypothetical protein
VGGALYSPTRDLRIAIQSINGVLTTAQARTILQEPWLGVQLPASLASDGASLAPYDDHSDPLTR